jgi:hypothetical protein
MGRLVAVVVGVDVLFCRHQFWQRLMVNVEGALRMARAIHCDNDSWHFCLPSARAAGSGRWAAPSPASWGGIPAGRRSLAASKVDCGEMALFGMRFSGRSRESQELP